MSEINPSYETSRPPPFRCAMAVFRIQRIVPSLWMIRCSSGCGCCPLKQPIDLGQHGRSILLVNHPIPEVGIRTEFPGSVTRHRLAARAMHRFLRLSGFNLDGVDIIRRGHEQPLISLLALHQRRVELFPLGNFQLCGHIRPPSAGPETLAPGLPPTLLQPSSHPRARRPRARQAIRQRVPTLKGWPSSPFRVPLPDSGTPPANQSGCR